MPVVGANEERFRIDIADLDIDFRVLRFRGNESISKPFVYDVTLVTQDEHVDLSLVIGKHAVLSVHTDTDDSIRLLNGIIHRIDEIDIGSRYSTYKIFLSPFLWHLGKRKNCRIFQQMPVQKIIANIFESAGIPSDQYKFQLSETHQPLEYCVQYRESDLNFISRLMEEAGIYYYFRHTDVTHILVMTDHATSHQNIAEEHQLSFHPGDNMTPDRAVITEFLSARSVQSDAVVLRDFDFTRPTLSLEVSQQKEPQGLELFDYAGRYQETDIGDYYATVRLQAEQSQTHVCSVKSNSALLTPGFCFELTDFPREDVNGEYLVLSVHHMGEQPQVMEEVSSSTRGFSYGNSCVCVPVDTQYREPLATRKPRVEGVQSAIVVGPAGEEIYTDEFGRVKVKFPWDRVEGNDENSSCWVRVNQMWAGPGWGSMVIPRVGNEVLVDFVNGDPDRPIIIGQVYNGRNSTPYSLPEEKTKTTLKSNSSPNGEGFNEFRFEDKKGEEQIFVNAQKDIDLRVLNDRREWIGNDRHLIVARDKVEQIDRDQHSSIAQDQVTQIDRDFSLKIGGKQTIEVEGACSISVSEDVHNAFQGNFSQEIGSDCYVKASNIVLEAMSALTLKVGGNFIKIDGSGVTIVGSIVNINSGGSAGTASMGRTIPTIAALAAVESATATAAAVLQQDTQARQESFIEAHNDDEADDDAVERTWIEVELTDESGEPIPGERYEVELPDGRLASGTTGPDGVARVNGVPPGSCRIRFPNLDQDAWETA